MRLPVTFAVVSREIGGPIAIPNTGTFTARKGKIRSWVDRKLHRYLKRVGAIIPYYTKEEIFKEQRLIFETDSVGKVMDQVNQLRDLTGSPVQTVFIGPDVLHGFMRDYDFRSAMKFNVQSASEQGYHLDGVEFVVLPYITDPGFILPVTEHHSRR